MLTPSSLYPGVPGAGFMRVPPQLGVEAVPTVFLVIHLAMTVAFIVAGREVLTQPRGRLP